MTCGGRDVSPGEHGAPSGLCPGLQDIGRRPMPRGDAGTTIGWCRSKPSPRRALPLSSNARRKGGRTRGPVLFDIALRLSQTPRRTAWQWNAEWDFMPDILGHVARFRLPPCAALFPIQAIHLATSATPRAFWGCKPLADVRPLPNAADAACGSTADTRRPAGLRPSHRHQQLYYNFI